jgi:hypothetical protein
MKCALLHFLALAAIVVFSPVRGQASVFTNVTQPSGVAGAMTRHYETHPKWWLSGVNLVDLDGDGILDLFLAAHGAGAPLALLGDGQGHFMVAAGSYPQTEIHLAHDINEDGKLDLQMTFQDGGGKWWLNESVNGQLSFRDSGIVAGQGRCNALIDLNRDGKVDWLHERPGVVFEFGDGKGGFKRGGNLDIAQTKNEFNMHPADLNGDGFVDLAVHWGRYDLKEGRSRVYLNDGKMNFRDATSDCGLAEEGLTVKGTGDVNQDGALDLIAFEGKAPAIFLNDGKAHFSKMAGPIAGMEAASKPAYTSWGLAIVTDFNNDGIADIIWNGRNFLWLLRGTGEGRFAYANREWGIEDKSSASVDDGLCFGDIDADGDLDIIGYTGSLDGKRMINVYRNDSQPRNWLRVRPMGASGNRSAAGAKIRVTEERGGKLIWFEQVQVLDSQSAHSYYSLAQTERHFGLAARSRVDVSVEFYPSGQRVEKKAVKTCSILNVAEIPE